MDLPLTEVCSIIDRALQEDIAWGDLTTRALISRDWLAHGRVLAKQDGILAGIEVMALVFRRLDSAVEVKILKEDGMSFSKGEELALVQGPAASLLTAERVALNFLQRLSGIATETSKYVRAVDGLPVSIVDTRKTTPGLRILEKYAVRMGGGHNHRYNLSDGVLIKDNHLALLRAAGFSLREVVARARRAVPHTIRIEIEVESPEEAAEAARAGADLILLDNMSLPDLRRAVQAVAGRALTEASGGVRLDTVRAIAETGVDLISVGALTHSARSVDISLEFDSTLSTSSALP